VFRNKSPVSSTTTEEIIHYYNTECRIRHEFDLWTRSFRPAVEYTVSRMNIGM
jgi:hypothetical protein